MRRHLKCQTLGELVQGRLRHAIVRDAGELQALHVLCALPTEHGPLMLLTFTIVPLDLIRWGMH